MPNVTFIATRAPKGLKLVSPFVLFHSEGPILRVLFEKGMGYCDLYIHAQIIDTGDYLFVKIDHLKLLEYLNNKIALQEVVYSCNESSFIYQLSTDKNKAVHIEMPIKMLSNYRLTFAENRIFEASEGVTQEGKIQSLLDKLNELIRIDPFIEEDWFEADEKITKISVEASIYF